MYPQQQPSQPVNPTPVYSGDPMQQQEQPGGMPPAFANDYKPAPYAATAGYDTVPPGEARKDKRICGMKKMVFWIVLAAVIAVVVIGVGVGVGVGVSQSKDSGSVYHPFTL